MRSLNFHPKPRWRRRLLIGLSATVLLLILVIFSGPRNTFGPDVPTHRALPPVDATQLDAWLSASESAVKDLRPDVEKQVVWQVQPGQKAPWAVVYIHGFTATRQETAPLAEQVAQQLGASVFYTRLTGHGRSHPQAMGDASVQDWLADTVEAVRIGRALGDKVVVIACSTGATLATWLATHPDIAGADAYAFVSPNYGPKDKRSELINGPWGQSLAFALEGEMRGAPSSDPREENAWTTRYPTRALFPMMALVKHVRDSDLSGFRAPVLMLYSERDETVDPALTHEVFARLSSPNKVIEAVNYSEAVGQHVLAGDIRAPKATPVMARRIAEWVQGFKL